MSTERQMLTAAQLIEALSRIPADTLVTYVNRDSEYGVTYYEGVSGVSPIGTLTYGGILNSVDDFEEYEDD